MSLQTARVSSQTIRPLGMVPALPRNAALLRRVINEGKTLNQAVSGLTAVTRTHAVLQAFGDRTYYMVAITRDEAKELGFMELR